MQKIILLVFIASLAFSCKNNALVKGEHSLPAAPLSVEIVHATLRNKIYKVSDAGTVDYFNAAKFEWASEEKDTTSFYKNYMEERKNFRLHFMNDTTVQLQDDKKKTAATFQLEKDTSASVMLKITYADSSFSFNPGEAMMVTATYKIRGVDSTRLLVETPNEINRKKVVLLMNAQ